MPSTQFNLADAFETVTRVNPDRECVVWGDKRLTFSQVADRSRRLAAYLRSRGLGVHTDRTELAGHESGQDHLGIYLYNGNEYLESMLGAFMARVAPFNVNYRYVADELLYLLDNSQCRALVYHAAFAPVLAEVLDRLPRLDGARPGRRRLGQRAAARRRRLRDGCSPTPRRRLDVEPDRPTTSTSSTRAARPACRRACCGGSTTSSCRRWAAGTSSRRRRSRPTTSSRPRPPPSRAAQVLILPPLMHGAAQWADVHRPQQGRRHRLPRRHQAVRSAPRRCARSSATAAPRSPWWATPSPARWSKSSSRARTT